ncbi:hypothetical protein ES703_125095 [subsurface metagenome]
MVETDNEKAIALKKRLLERIKVVKEGVAEEK